MITGGYIFTLIGLWYIIFISFIVNYIVFLIFSVSIAVIHASFIDETHVYVVSNNPNEKDEENHENIHEDHTIFDTQIINKLEVLTDPEQPTNLI